MNAVYKLIFNVSTGTWAVASELTASRGKKNRTRLASAMAVALTLPAGAAMAADSPDALQCDINETASADGKRCIATGGSLSTMSGGIGTMATDAELNQFVKFGAVYGGAGADAATSGAGAVAVGRASAAGLWGTSFGSRARSATYGTAIGIESRSEGDRSTALGAWAWGSADSSVALGAYARATGTNSVAIGAGPTSGAAAYTGAPLASADRAVAVGANAQSTGERSIAIGASTSSSAASASALGDSATADGIGDVALGQLATTAGAGRGAVSVGVRANAVGTGTVALGGTSKANADRAVAVGEAAAATGVNSVALGAQSTATEGNTVSVGNTTANGQRRIVNMAAGTADTDAVNIAQLKPVVDALGGGATINTTTGAVTGPTYNIGGADRSTVGEALNNLDGRTNANERAIRDLVTDGAPNPYIAGGGANNGAAASAPSRYTNSVALGINSVANQNNVVSVGNSSGEGVQVRRRIINLADGASPTDAATVGQVNALVGGVQTSTLSALNDVNSKLSTMTQVGTMATVNDDYLKIDGPAVPGEGEAAEVGQNTYGVAIGRSASATGLSSAAIGAGASASGIESLALGSNSEATADNALAMGGALASGESAVALGNGNTASGNYSLTSGFNSTAAGTNSVAMGNTATVRANDAIAIGTSSSIAAGANNSIALGRQASVAATGVNSVALGAGSVADRANAVAVGSATQRRQIINLAAGTNATDGVNVSQLSGLAAVIGGGTAVGTDGSITSPSFDIGTGTGATTVNDALIGLRDRINNMGDVPDSLVTFDAAANADAGAVKVASNLGGTTVDFAGVGENDTPIQRRLTGVAAGTAATDAANVGQLAASATSVARALGGTSTADANGVITGTSYAVGTGTTPLTNVNDALLAIDTMAKGTAGDVTTVNNNLTQLTTNLNNGTVGIVTFDADANANDGAVKVAAGMGGTTVDFAGADEDDNPTQRRLTGVAAGTAATDAANVGQLAASATSVATALGGTSTADANGVITGTSYAVGTGTTPLTNVNDALLAIDTMAKGTAGDVTTVNNNLTQLTTNLSNGTVGIVTFDADANADAGAVKVASNLGGTTVDFAGVGENDTPIQRRLTGIARGTATTDAVNVSQLSGLASVIGGGAAVGADGSITSPSFDIGTGTGATTVNDALTGLRDRINDLGDGTEGLVTFDEMANAEAGAVKVASNRGGTTVDFAGIDEDDNPTQRRLTGVAAGTAATDAANLGQLAASATSVASALGGTSTADANGVITGTRFAVGAPGTQASTNVHDALLAINTVANGAADGVTNLTTNLTNLTNNLNMGVGNPYLAGSGFNNGTAASVRGNALNSVALGTNSVAHESNTVSVGNTSGTGVAARRRITSVLNGLHDSDAATVGQMNALVGGVQTSTESALNEVNARLSTLSEIGTMAAVDDTYLKVDGAATPAPGQAATVGASTNGVAIGVAASATGVSSAAIGAGSTASGTEALALGSNSTASADNALAMGGATASGGSAVALGNGNRATGNFALAGGSNSTAAGTNAIAMGNTATANAADTIALGTASSVAADATNSIALGRTASVTAAGLNSVALGAGSVADAANTISVGSATAQRRITNVAEGTQGTDAVNFGQLQRYVRDNGGGTGNALAVTYTDTDRDSITLGNIDAETGTKISNVAAGAVSATSTDAINGKQLFDTATSVATALGGGATVGADGVISAPTYTVGDTAHHNVGTAIGAINTSITNLTNGTAGLVQYDATANANAGGLTVGKDVAGTTVDFSGTSQGATVSRRLTGVAAGIADTNAVNVAQLRGIASAIGGGAAVGTDGSITAPSFVINGTPYNNVGQALTNIDGRTTTNTTNIQNLTTRVDQIGEGGAADPLAVAYTNTDKDEIALAGEDGTTISNVKAGAVSATSMDAINGAQLHGTATSVATALGGNSVVNADGTVSAPSYTIGTGDYTNVGDAFDAVDTSLTGLGDRLTVTEGDVTNLNTIVNNLSNGTAGLVTIDPTTSNVHVAKDAGGTVVDMEGTEGRRRVSGVANGTQADDAVTIAQLRAAGAIDPVSGQTLSVLTYDGDDLARATLGGTNGTVIANLGNGLVAAGSREAINGGQLFEVKADWEARFNGLDGRVGTIEQGISDGTIGSGGGNGDSGLVGPGAGDRSVVIGEGSTATGNDSVAIGSGSTADRDREVSVGAAGNERVISNVATGTRPTDAVNVQQMEDRFTAERDWTNGRFQAVDKRIDRMGAISAAYAGMAINTAGLEGEHRVGAGIGQQNGRSALAVGYQRVLGEKKNISVSLGGAFSGSDKSMSAGAGFSW